MWAPDFSGDQSVERDDTGDSSIVGNPAEAPTFHSNLSLLDALPRIAEMPVVDVDRTGARQLGPKPGVTAVVAECIAQAVGTIDDGTGTDIDESGRQLLGQPPESLPVVCHEHAGHQGVDALGHRVRLVVPEHRVSPDREPTDRGAASLPRRGRDPVHAPRPQRTRPPPPSM